MSLYLQLSEGWAVRFVLLPVSFLAVFAAVGNRLTRTLKKMLSRAFLTVAASVFGEHGYFCYFYLREEIGISD